MILSGVQQRWCAEHGLGTGYDDDNDELTQFCHVVEATGERQAFIDGPGDFEVEAALCRSLRLWFGDARGHVWPVDDEGFEFHGELRPWTPEERKARNDHWANITCTDCLRILHERAPDVFPDTNFVPHVSVV